MRSHFLPASFALQLIFAVAVAPAFAGPAVPVTTCGQSVPKRGVLTADLDCSAFDGPAIVLAKSAKLNLAGHTLTASDIGVFCEVGACEVRGPGTIKRPAYDPLLTFDTGTYGIRGLVAVRVRDVTFQHWTQGVRALNSVSVRDCTVEDGGWGVVGGPVKIVGSTITGHDHAGTLADEGTRDGVHYKFYSCKVKDTTFSGNAVDIESYRRPVVRASSCTTSDQLTIPETPYGGGDEWGVCTP